MANTRPAPLQAWHDIVASKDAGALSALLAEECVFRSPAVFAPQQGKSLSMLYLSCALVVLGPTLRYQHEWFDDSSAVLEFEADLDATLVHGIDMMRWNADGRLTSFTVMVRPKRGLDALIERMAAELTAAASDQ
jgi:hypothetical protein